MTAKLFFMNTTSRREFLKQAGTFGACVCCLGAMSLMDSCAASKNISATTETSDMFSLPVSSFGDQNFITVQTKKFEEPIFIIRQTNGSYDALRMKCTHRGCTVRVPKDNADKLVCPCHGSVFSTQGMVLKGPAMKPLQSFPVTTESQSITVHFN